MMILKGKMVNAISKSRAVEFEVIVETVTEIDSKVGEEEVKIKENVVTVTEKIKVVVDSTSLVETFAVDVVENPIEITITKNLWRLLLHGILMKTLNLVKKVVTACEDLEGSLSTSLVEVPRCFVTRIRWDKNKIHHPARTRSTTSVREREGYLFLEATSSTQSKMKSLGGGRSPMGPSCLQSIIRLNLGKRSYFEAASPSPSISPRTKKQWSGVQ